MTVTDARKEKAAFSDPYMTADEVLVQKAGEPAITAIDGLKGKTIAVRKPSSYRTTIDELNAKGAGITGVDAPEDRETEQLIDDVAKGKIPMTVADSNIAAVELTYRNDVQMTLPLKPGQQIAYAARKDNPKLKIGRAHV